jgi:phosphoglycolate phosphatase
MLILFDIDMTLITTGGAGMKAMQDAGRELFGASFSTDGIEFAGRLDPLIITDMLVKHGVADGPARHTEFRAVYRRHLERRLQQPGNRTALPGVTELLRELAGRAVMLGLLTGNFEETGSMKLRACGIDPTGFAVRVWGDECRVHPPRREHLVPVGLERGRAVLKRPLEPAHVAIIGDTPHDVACARAHGCRSVGVATGKFGLDDLRAAGADVALSDLSDTHRVISWLMKSCGPDEPSGTLGNSPH